ncbi:hypothetical protein A2160_06030 [Candidatus Beckwithbacteria bacterium RBG_13_42_9]|uniref:RNA-binding protein KhpA n=1 Tax=Candidatus Beckwithbacteria bacterium RBG_13_42_9 TaxID=1797457 RepID=A0A1F5E5C2_9BACT|nr:MAG: hypothetical protein A2160_06030 [Candidatus Beckwithbacteria bacterium RBG_13_42_9]
MKDLLDYLVKALVDKPEEVKIGEVNNSPGNTVLTLHVAQADMGKIIGKQGKIIRALRLLLKVKGIKTGQYARLELAEESSPDSLG